ncbi:glycosyl hydrolases family 38 N-terminal domain-containing protein [Gongronella butleri]|nr:glycosyl hydrolases family 38 N-terminal domain-containing protein [Gongronella butleri]
MTLDDNIDATPKIPENIARSRINNFLASNGQFHSMGIHRGLWLHRKSAHPHVRLSFFSVPDMKRISFKDAVANKFEDFDQLARKFGPSWSTHWFKIDILIPKDMDGLPVTFQWNMDNEGLVWSTDGEPLQGLTGGDGQERHEYILTKKAKEGERFSFYIESACNGMFGVGASDSMVPDPNRYFRINTADLVVPNAPVQRLYHDLWVIYGVAYDTVNDSSRARQAVWVLNSVINQFSLNDKDIDKCLALTSEFLSKTNGTGVHQVTAVGNCHIDSAWLWPYGETKRKVARSWASQLHLLERYPDYVFTGSQVQQYEWLEELYPTLLDRIKKKEKQGRWEIIGGSWVEHDTNMPSGESLCRQMLLGQRYFEKHFGKRTNVFWLPDSFGYSGQLPQVLKQSGCDYFFTQKLSWNNINKFPLTTFWWTGIDNSSILTHLTPADTYNAEVRPSELQKCIRNHHDLEYSNKSLLVFGHGDGGGGPTPEHLERLQRLKDLDGVPTCKPGTVTNFFKDVEATSHKLQSYKGELYLEFHRGTYTTQALVKRGNRQCEVMIRDVEFMATLAKLLANSRKGTYAYPQDDITRLWKLICLNQFHDCLPGSAIGLAFVDVHNYHREVIFESMQLRRDAQDSVLFNDSSAEKGKHDGIAVFNTLPWPRTEVLTLPQKNTAWLNEQKHQDNEYVVVRQVPGLSVAGITATSLTKTEEEAKAYKTIDGHLVLENGNLKAVFDGDAQLVELHDKHSDRGNLVAPGAKGNVMQMYEDVPTYWDAWDVEIYHLQKFKVLAGGNDAKIVAKGPLVASLERVYTISSSSWMVQTISLTAVGSYIEFSTSVEWHESHQFLKTEFNWNIISDFATYDIQYGVLRRPNHYNTTHDSAKFEVCGHKFADLSDATYGVALMNNCKYGYATHGTSQRLSLLRSPKGPDENADMGTHTFTYAIYPHKGNFASSDVMRKALELNVPLSVRQTTHLDKSTAIVPSLFTLDPPDRVILDTIKLAEDDKGHGKTVVLRLYEAYGGQCTVQVESMLAIRDLQVSNVLEDDVRPLEGFSKHKFTLTLTPFQIMTLKLVV